MKRLKRVTDTAAIIVLLICIYTFLHGNEVFEGDFKNDPIAWYFLAKGLFCSLSLYLSVRILEAIKKFVNSK